MVFRERPKAVAQISNGSPSVTISDEVFIRLGRDGLDAIKSRYRFSSPRLLALSHA